jgi:uncharacterized small protein (DUF1192 family)
MAHVRDLIGLLSDNEDKIMELYWAYEKKFPRYAKIWAVLAEEEKNHANMLRSFSMLADGRELEADLEHISMDSIRQSISALQKEIDRAKDDKISAAYAFETALRTENSLMEKEIFDVFDSKDRDLRALFNRLSADTQRHYEMIKKLAAQAK